MSATNKEVRVAVILLLCLLVVGFWEVMSHRSERPWKAFQLSSADFDDFKLDTENWTVRQLPVHPTPAEPEILKYDLVQKNVEQSGSATCRVRLVHGYNMVDCMRIKGYVVEEVDLSDVSAFIGGSSVLKFAQVWRLKNSVGDESIWVTSMLKAGDFSVTELSTTDMAFPRVGIPDNPDWLPAGFKVSSLRHPVSNFRLLMRSKWNAARFDWMVFLKLKQPPWADEENLTLVSNAAGGDDVVEHVLKAHGFFYGELIKWNRESVRRQRLWRTW